MTLYPSAVHPHDSREWDREADLRSIRDVYERYASAGRARLWDERLPGYRRLTEELQTMLLRNLEASVPADGGVIVDLGCGDGALAADTPLARAARQWIGVDLRPEVIDLARVRFPGLTFLVASADAVPLDTGRVDAVVARVLFSSLPSTRLEAAVAAEIGRLLRPGGWLVWLDLRYANPTNPAVHGLSVGRLARLFPGWRREVRSAGLLPPIARRLGPVTPIAYPALAALPPLHSHVVGRLQRPWSDG